MALTMTEKGKSDTKERPLRMFMKRILGDSESERKESREIISALINTGDKAKTEVVRLVAKEARSYIEALELHKDLNHLLTNYSLELNASFSLKPLKEEIENDKEVNQPQETDPE
jgi:hypothetical protein